MSDTDKEEQIPARVAHGNVTNVKPIPTRGVTRIEIELPIEAHVEATSLLFGKDVLIVCAKLEAPYGITDGSVPKTEPPQPKIGLAGTAPRPIAAAPAQRMGLARHEDSIDVVRWLGVRCSAEDFQNFLAVRNEAAAVAKVREVCGVESRAHIPGNPAARRAFFTQIYHPFVRWSAQQHGLDMDEQTLGRSMREIGG